MKAVKKIGLVSAVLIAASVFMTMPAQAATNGRTAPTPPGASAEAPGPSAKPTDVASRIAKDPHLRYVTVPEAVRRYGFDPATAPSDTATESTAPPTLLSNSWWGCNWQGKPDSPHVTSGQASVHGYWVYKSGSCPSTATVSVKLQALGCSNFGCTWVTQKTSTVYRVKPGSGTGHWATPHKTCASTKRVGWRGFVQVSLTNFWSPYGPDYGPQVDLSCSP